MHISVGRRYPLVIALAALLAIVAFAVVAHEGTVRDAQAERR